MKKKLAFIGFILYHYRRKQRALLAIQTTGCPPSLDRLDRVIVQRARFFFGFFRFSLESLTFRNICEITCFHPQGSYLYPHFFTFFLHILNGTLTLDGKKAEISITSNKGCNLGFVCGTFAPTDNAKVPYVSKKWCFRQHAQHTFWQGSDPWLWNSSFKECVITRTELLPVLQETHFNFCSKSHWTCTPHFISHAKSFYSIQFCNCMIAPKHFGTSSHSFLQPQP